MSNVAIDTVHYRTVLGQFATGVVAVTSVGPVGNPLGLAVGSFSSVSLDPPLVAFFVAHTSTTFPAIARTGRFCINILAHDQRDVCTAFSRSGGEKFRGIEHRPSPGGAPILVGTLGWIDCTISVTHRLGDHDLVVGEVKGLAATNADKAPLVFHRSAFHDLQGLE
jgi:3-hydroxy-9,10-secoandrosta-1,3,5(10)-triene-9,17-dione monooxygenase reductase component